MPQAVSCQAPGEEVMSQQSNRAPEPGLNWGWTTHCCELAATKVVSTFLLAADIDKKCQRFAIGTLSECNGAMATRYEVDIRLEPGLQEGLVGDLVKSSLVTFGADTSSLFTLMRDTQLREIEDGGDV